MKTLDERITEAEGALEEAKASDDPARQARAEARLETLQEAKEFHTKEFERVGKKIRSEGGEAKEKEIADELGVPLAEAKTMLAEYQEIQAATATDTETERKAREKAEVQRDEEIQKRKDADQRADERLKRSELKLALLAQGAREDRLARLMREANLSEVEVEEDEVKNLEPVIELLKEEIPEWFGAAGPPRGVPPTPPAGDPNDLSADQRQANEEIARRQLHRMF